VERDEQAHYFDDPGNVRRFLRVFYALCLIAVLLDPLGMLLHQLGLGELRHAERSWEGLPGFYAAYGFVACVLLVLVAKKLRGILMRDEDYYER
jgi:hypothetical protein